MPSRACGWAAKVELFRETLPLAVLERVEAEDSEDEDEHDEDEDEPEDEDEDDEGRKKKSA
jgi:hypothetical protein